MTAQEEQWQYRNPDLGWESPEVGWNTFSLDSTFGSAWHQVTDLMTAIHATYLEVTYLSVSGNEKTYQFRYFPEVH